MVGYKLVYHSWRVAQHKVDVGSDSSTAEPWNSLCLDIDDGRKEPVSTTQFRRCSRRFGRVIWLGSLAYHGRRKADGYAGVCRAIESGLWRRLWNAVY